MPNNDEIIKREVALDLGDSYEDDQELDQVCTEVLKQESLENSSLPLKKVKPQRLQSQQQPRGKLNLMASEGHGRPNTKHI